MPRQRLSCLLAVLLAGAVLTPSAAAASTWEELWAGAEKQSRIILREALNRDGDKEINDALVERMMAPFERVAQTAEHAVPDYEKEMEIALERVIEEEMDAHEESLLEKIPAVDRYYLALRDTKHDEDCMRREFDASDESFDEAAAIAVFRKCKILVLRNAIDPTFLGRFRGAFYEFFQKIQRGAISHDGRTTNGETYYMHRIDHKRWEVVLPEEFAQTPLILQPQVSKVLSNPGILGEDMALHSLGCALGEAGAEAQRWHKDNPYLFGNDALASSGFAGHDLPSYSVTMLVPLLNMTHHHGPTEFCMGTGHMDGIDFSRSRMEDATLVPEAKELFGEMHSSFCPVDYWRCPMVGFGDLVLFDYQLRHRGGPNTSDQLRSVLYMTFSRSWYKDSNFRNRGIGGDPPRRWTSLEPERNLDSLALRQLKRTIGPARFAIPDAAESEWGDNPGNGCTDEAQHTSSGLEALRGIFSYDPSRGPFSAGNNDFTLTEDLGGEVAGKAAPHVHLVRLSNRDIDTEGASFKFGGQSIPSSSGQDTDIEVVAGTRIVFSANGIELKAWRVPPSGSGRDFYQFVAALSNLDRPLNGG